MCCIPPAHMYRLVDNRVNIDRRYEDSGDESDVESVDSFEGKVRFFPSDDDASSSGASGSGSDGGGHDRQHAAKTPPVPPGSNGGAAATRRTVKRSFHPGPANVLQALTMSSASDFINLERMETIGDGFLKFVVTVHLYLTYPHAHEGKLSHLRSRIVST